MAAAAAALWPFFTATATLLILGSYAATSTTPRVEDKPLKFTYTGAMGPDKWASLNPNFSLCAKGKSQSPIDIVTGQAVPNTKLEPLLRNYNSVNVTLVNYKFTVGIEYPDHTGEINVGGKKYAFKQMHWHSPSEHRINGKRYAAELHMVHVSDDGKVIAIATLYEYGPPDPLLASIYGKLNQLALNVKTQETGPIAFGPFHPTWETPKKYYKYVGSSSIPPCSEDLVYIVLTKTKTISTAQVQALKAPMDIRCKNNARPCQPSNGRLIEVYEDHN